jgi:HK97 family phage prohead protease
MENVVKFYKPEIKSVDETSHTVEAIVSTKSVDRDGDIVMPDAFKNRLKTYKQHPVLLSSHNYNDLRKNIGEAEGIKVTEKGLEAKFKYYVGMGNEEADWAWVLAQRGIASFSIGFMGHEFEWMKTKQEDGTEAITGRKFTDVELLEISQVVVPSNRQALQMSLSRVAEEKELCELVEKGFKDGTLKCECLRPDQVPESKPTNPNPSSGASTTEGGDLITPMVTPPTVAPEEPVAEQAKTVPQEGNDNKHYSEKLFGEEGSKPDPEPTLSGSDLESAIKQAVAKLLQKEKI